MRRISRRLTYANVISTLALFLAIGGGAAVAATQLAKNSVGPKAIKPNAVGPAKIKAGAVTGDKIANGAVGAKQLANGAVGANQLANGAVGATKLATGAVGTTQIANGAVGGNQLANGAVSAAKLANGAVGGAQLTPGSVGGSKLGAINARTASVTVAKDEIKGTSAACSPGETLIGGGTSWNTTASNQLVLTAESKKTGPTTWQGAGVNQAPVALTFNVIAYCVAG